MADMETNDREPSDSDDEESTAPAAHESVDDHLLQNKIFDEWMHRQANGAGFKKNLREPRQTHDNSLSLRGLVLKQESAEIIHTPRDYQLELFERAKKENLIAVLDTGLGKTLIAVLLIRWVLDQEAEDRAAGKPHKIAFFLVPSVQLALQQTAVLQNNLSYPVDSLYGAKGVDYWSRADWHRAMGQYRVIVCTAAVLQDCLDKAFIDVTQINLLVFDEAHHTKKNHNYAQIVKNHYLKQLDLTKRPRIFGMTASPVDAKASINDAASKLESLLNSKVVSTGDLSSFQAKRRPEEKTFFYNGNNAEWDSQIAQDLANKLQELPHLQEVYDSAKEIARHLGSTCADQAMLHAIEQRTKYKLEVAIERDFRGRTRPQDVASLDRKRAEYAEILKYLETTLRQADAPIHESNKVTVLRQILQSEFENTAESLCLVFVERRSTAHLLSALFDKSVNTNIHCGHIVGHGHIKALHEQQDSFREQVLTMTKFRRGEINVLFATQVAEEGLDVPECNLVIRFDLYKSMIQYIQSRGRARQAKSLFVHMVDSTSFSQRQMQQDVRIAEMRMRDWCNSLPEDRRLLSDEVVLQQMMTDDADSEEYIADETGASLNYGNALACLEHYASTLPATVEETSHPIFVPINYGAGFQYRVILPDGAAIRSVEGKSRSRKLVARQAAAFAMSRELHKLKALDYHFLPTDRKKAHAMKNAILALNTKATNQYSLLVKPAIWSNKTNTRQLWKVEIDFSPGFEQEHRRIIMLARNPMPDFPAFPLFRNDGVETVVLSKTSHQPIEVTHGEVQWLASFTYTVFDDVFSKKYKRESEKLSYFLAPASSDGTIDWELLWECAQEREKWTPCMITEYLIGKVLIDPTDGTRKVVVHSIAADLKPQDAVPQDAAKYKHMTSILDYSVSLWAKARSQAVWTADQPVFVGQLLNLRRNMLSSMFESKETAGGKVYLCPEPLRISRLPSAVVVSCLAWPSIIWRFDAVLLALEACKHVSISCSPSLALAAVTKDSDDLKDGGLVTVHHGMGENYERLEFLGDCFLKLATTLAVFIGLPQSNEETSHVERMLMLCNKNLLSVSNELGLSKYIRSQGFNRRLWYPEGLNLLEGKGVKSNDDVYHNQKHAIGDKTVADVSEALIGAAFISHDRPGEWHPNHWREAVLAVTKLVHNPLHSMQKWEDYITAYKVPSYQTRPSNASQRDLAEIIFQAHDYHFRSPTLLRSAFLHASEASSYEGLPNYERLEFLGDALLDMVIISHIFYKYPDKDESWMSEAKTIMAGNKFFSALAVELGFHKHLRHSSSAMGSQIQSYVYELEDAKLRKARLKNAKPENAKLKDDKLKDDKPEDDKLEHLDYWLHVKSDGPKFLADLVESYVGVLFIDSGFNYGEVQRFFDKHILPYFRDMSIYAGHVKGQPMTTLVQVLQQELGCRGFKILTRNLPEAQLSARKELIVAVLVHNEVVAWSTGTSARNAGDRAAQEAHQALKGMTVDQFRVKCGCTCIQEAK